MIHLPDSLYTGRLVLRRFCKSDLEPFALINSDPVVTQFLGRSLNRGESDEFVQRIESGFERNGFGLWAVELKNSKQFIGYVGLSKPTFNAHFTPCVEIGWRLAREHWNQGYATEAARVVLDDGFGRLALEEIVSFTSTKNQRSIKVMQRLRMKTKHGDNFFHPALPTDHELAAHVLYRISASRGEVLR